MTLCMFKVRFTGLVSVFQEIVAFAFRTAIALNGSAKSAACQILIMHRIFLIVGELGYQINNQMFNMNKKGKFRSGRF